MPKPYLAYEPPGEAGALVEITDLVASLLWKTKPAPGEQAPGARIVFKPTAAARSLGINLSLAPGPVRFVYAREGKQPGQEWRASMLQPFLADDEEEGATVYFEHDGREERGRF